MELEIKGGYKKLEIKIRIRNKSLFYNTILNYCAKPYSLKRTKNAGKESSMARQGMQMKWPLNSPG